MKTLAAFAALSLLPLAAPAVAQQAPAAPQATPGLQGVPVHDDGLVATWYPPASGKRGPAILVLGGSEGGEGVSKALGRKFAEAGYGVLALAYFRTPGLPEQLQEIRLEYFRAATDWLARQPLVDAKKIGIWGASKGGEAVLLIASHDPRFHAVVAAVPSSVVWQGINYTNFMDNKSSFSLDGKPMAYVPYDNSTGFKSVLDLYQRSLAKAAAYPDAVIPVERIAGPVLLISGADDAMWPSGPMSKQVIERLDAKHFRFAHRQLDYPNAGHSIAFPDAPTKPTGDTPMMQMGGTDAGNAAARIDAWKQTLAFFADTLGAPAK
ncbi:acyl-CoA thioester hydrolase/BAAT C-terminal domain-containing protein [Sphingomonas sp. KR3-1]|uniref:acyl-CoA thioester hydrolase/BAAT C-terminal domain-containing protein n=1 Tax=Sphingomonas sp. KR3-1 TaxID=3156611 RepID=UPI0032B5C12A